MKKIAVINNAEPGIKEYTWPIEQMIKKTNNDFLFLEYADCVAFDFDSIDGAILTGSPQGDDIVEHHLPYFQWIKDFKKPVLGICAGHHVTGVMYGAELLRSEEPESGDVEIQCVKPDPLFKDISQTFRVKQMHNDSITLPPDFQLLATSRTCKNQLMKHKNKPIYTCQFHPEFYNHQLIKNFIGLCKHQCF